MADTGRQRVTELWGEIRKRLMNGLTPHTRRLKKVALPSSTPVTHFGKGSVFLSNKLWPLLNQDFMNETRIANNSAIGNNPWGFRSSEMWPNFLSPHTYLTHVLHSLQPVLVTRDTTLPYTRRQYSSIEITKDCTNQGLAVRGTSFDACTTSSNGPQLSNIRWLHVQRKKVGIKLKSFGELLLFSRSVEHRRGTWQERVGIAEPF